MKALPILALFLLTLLGCRPPNSPTVTSPHDWKYSELAAAIDGFRKKEAVEGTKVPQRIRSIEPAGADGLKVYLSDHEPLSGFGCELILKKLPERGWAVRDSRYFDQ